MTHHEDSAVLGRAACKHRLLSAQAHHTALCPLEVSHFYVKLHCRNSHTTCFPPNIKCMHSLLTGLSMAECVTPSAESEANRFSPYALSKHSSDTGEPRCNQLASHVH